MIAASLPSDLYSTGVQQLLRIFQKEYLIILSLVEANRRGHGAHTLLHQKALHRLPVGNRCSASPREIIVKILFFVWARFGNIPIEFGHLLLCRSGFGRAGSLFATFCLATA